MVNRYRQESLRVLPAHHDSVQLKDFESFFASGGRQGLIFFYLPPTTREGQEDSTKPIPTSTSSTYNSNGRRLWITDGTIDPYTGTCLFFLRMNNSKPITMLNIHQVIALICKCKAWHHPLNFCRRCTLDALSPTVMAFWGQLKTFLSTSSSLHSPKASDGASWRVRRVKWPR